MLNKQCKFVKQKNKSSESDTLWGGYLNLGKWFGLGPGPRNGEQLGVTEQN